MKITPSKDGDMRGTLKIAFRVSLNEIVDSIILKLTDEWIFEDKDNKAMAVETALKYYSSRAKILKDVEYALRSHGLNLWARVEKCASDEVIKQIREQALILAIKKFPQLKTRQ